MIAIIYYSVFASDMYVSEAKFAIRSSKPGVSLSGMAALFGGSDSTGAGQDSVVVEKYIHSYDMLEALDKKYSLFDQYSDEHIDIVARLDNEATKEDFLDYIKDKIEISRDEASNIISLRVRAFTAKLAKALALEIIALSENVVNRLSARIEEDTLVIAREEVDRAAQKAREASERITTFRGDNSSVDPSAETSAVLAIVSSIEAKLTDSRAQLSEKRAYMRETSPEIRAIINRIKALNEQLAVERKRLAGTQGNSMSGLIQQYQPLILEQELMREQYSSALASLEAARLEAQRKKQYLITFVLPTLPDEAIEPRRLMSILNVMMFAFLFYSVGGLMWSALKDHIGR